MQRTKTILVFTARYCHTVPNMQQSKGETTETDLAKLLNRVYVVPDYPVPRVLGELHHERQQSKQRIGFMQRQRAYFKPTPKPKTT